jgi:radical SAM-linked protein
MRRNENAMTTNHGRFRIRFRKQDELRFIGHLDLARAWERLLLRCGLKMRMSLGMRPKPKINFPLALAVGVASIDELVEIELCDPPSAEQLQAILAASAPAGLVIERVEPVAEGTSKPRVRCVRYELPLPAERRAETERKLRELLAAETWPIARDDKGRIIDLREYLYDGRMTDVGVEFDMRVSQAGTARPREALAALGLGDLEQTGLLLTRTMVELEPDQTSLRPAGGVCAAERGSA